MRLPFSQSLIIVIIIAVTSYIIRVLPFTIFRDESKLPNVVKYLGRVLPFSVITMLIVYCFKDVSLNTTEIISSVIAAIYVVVVHYKFTNMLFSIGGGTIIYMILLRVI